MAKSQPGHAVRDIGIRLHEIDCTEKFGQIKENFVTEYVNGRTPNPCIVCNERVKFKVLYDFAMENGFDAIATGHYAKIVEIESDSVKRFALKVAEDTKKDQTYMLYRLPQSILSRLIFPLSEGRKTEIRKSASEHGISSADRGDSQEICFLPEGKHTEYIETVAGKCPEGDFVDENGTKLGRHKGIIHYTVGQRKGLGIALGSRVFVTDIDADTGKITLSPQMKGKYQVKICDIVFSGMEKPVLPYSCKFVAKLRYTAPLINCNVEFVSDNEAILHFDSPVNSAPGQSAVLYDNDTVMFGGFIRK